MRNIQVSREILGYTSPPIQKKNMRKKGCQCSDTIAGALLNVQKNPASQRVPHVQQCLKLSPFSKLIAKSATNLVPREVVPAHDRVYLLRCVKRGQYTKVGVHSTPLGVGTPKEAATAVVSPITPCLHRGRQVMHAPSHSKGMQHEHQPSHARAPYTPQHSTGHEGTAQHSKAQHNTGKSTGSSTSCGTSTQPLLSHGHYNTTFSFPYPRLTK